MKKSLLLVAILMAFNSMFAGPVDKDYAKYLGEKFVKVNFEQKQNSSLDLVYTMNLDSGEPCFYVFNVSDYGFVFVSANDYSRPILGYSEEGIFDVNNIAPGLGFMMEEYKNSISYAVENNIEPSVNIVSEWKSLENCGLVKPNMRGLGIDPLCTTKWNQSWPYNKFCPEQPASWASNGHVVVGCVATAMAQIMAYWDHPVQGQGSHTYNAALYGPQTANFGETTYDWANMPNTISSSSPEVEIDAVALISYHCGVSVNMQYDVNGDGSGAHSSDVPAAIRNYFRYAQSTYESKGNYDTWLSKLKSAIDMRRPVYYSGCSTQGCHAFVCDGYDQNELFHFNYGWGGSGDGFFAPDAIEYNVSQVGAIFDMMPVEVYNNAANAPTNVSVTPAANNELSATVTWTNPTHTLAGIALPSQIESVIVERDGVIIHVEENSAPGATINFVDDDVPCFSNFTYKVYVLIDGAYGAPVEVEDVSFGPTCEWSILLQSSVFQGMRGAEVSVYNFAGAKIASLTTTTSALTTFDVDMPLGGVYFTYTPHATTQEAYTLTILVKDSDNNTLFNYNGMSNELAPGTFLTTNNSCGNTNQCDAPSNLVATTEGSDVVLTWDAVEDAGYGYNIYRDGILYRLVQENTFTDVNVPVGGHCYEITALCDGGDTQSSNEFCAMTTEGCEPASELWLEYMANHKPKIHWTAPENDNLTGYYIYRRTGEDGEWKYLKSEGPNKVSYSDNTSLEDGTWYYYRVIAFYQDIDCMSTPALAKYNENEFFVKAYFSTDGVNDIEAGKVAIYPNPANDNITIDAKGIRNITIVNMVGQKVFESSLYTDKALLNTSNFETGIYLVRIVTDEFEATERISIVR